MANIVAIKLADTFSTLKDRINEIITKLNKITMDDTSLTLSTITTEPTSSSGISGDQAVLWGDTPPATPEVKITIKKGTADAVTYNLTKST